MDGAGALPATQHDTALFEGVTVLCLAQFDGGALTVPQHTMVVRICTLTGDLAGTVVVSRGEPDAPPPD